MGNGRWPKVGAGRHGQCCGVFHLEERNKKKEKWSCYGSDIQKLSYTSRPILHCLMQPLHLVLQSPSRLAIFWSSPSSVGSSMLSGFKYNGISHKIPKDPQTIAQARWCEMLCHTNIIFSRKGVVGVSKNAQEPSVTRLTDGGWMWLVTSIRKFPSSCQWAHW